MTKNEERWFVLSLHGTQYFPTFISYSIHFFMFSVSFYLLRILYLQILNTDAGNTKQKEMLEHDILNFYINTHN